MSLDQLQGDTTQNFVPFAGRPLLEAGSSLFPVGGGGGLAGILDPRGPRIPEFDISRPMP